MIRVWSSVCLFIPLISLYFFVVLMLFFQPGELEKCYFGHTNAVRCLLVVDKTIWSGADDRSIRVWPFGNAENDCLQELQVYLVVIVMYGLLTCLTGTYGQCTLFNQM